MRKKTVEFSLKTLFDNIFWYALYLLPVLLIVLYMISNGNFVDFGSYLELSGFGLLNDNVIVNGLRSIFMEGGVLPLFVNDLPIIICGWFVACMLLHLFIDFILFIPRLCHKWLNSFTKDN